MPNRFRALTQRGIAHVSARDSSSKDRLFLGAPSVKLVSMHSSKGLEFEHVFIPAVDTMPGNGEDEAAEAKLLYVAMTRAMSSLVMTSSSNERFAASISGIVARNASLAA